RVLPRRRPRLVLRRPLGVAVGGARGHRGRRSDPGPAPGQADGDRVSAPRTSVISPEESGLRLDKFLTRRYPSYSRSFFQDLIGRGLVEVDGRPAAADRKLREGESVAMRLARADWSEQKDFEKWVRHED